MVHNGKLELQEEYTKKAKDLEISNRVARSSAVSESRVKKMQARDGLLMTSGRAPWRNCPSFARVMVTKLLLNS